MHHFTYRDSVLHAEDVAIPMIADAVGTPFYCYSTATLERHYRVFAEAFADLSPLICFAIKANSNQAVLATLARLGAGMDVVSEGELRRALAAGVPGDRIIFAGVGKTRDEMAFALDARIKCFNVESAAELEALADVAQAKGQTAHVAIRVNPDVDPRTHAKISTGQAETKFGVPFAEALGVYARARTLDGIVADGVHMHIGSQITDLAPFERAFQRMAELVDMPDVGALRPQQVDLGGGLGVPYRGANDIPPHPDEYARVVRETLGDRNLEIAFEPGRMIAANAGILVTRVVRVKSPAGTGDARESAAANDNPTTGKHFAIVDAAMNDLIRPTLYEAHHDIWPVTKPGTQSAGHTAEPTYDVVGPVCETGDYLALGRRLPEVKEGDALAVMTTGAYGAVQSGTYNTRLLVPEVLVSGSAYAVVRPRQSYDDLIGLDRMAPWLSSEAPVASMSP